VWRGKSVRKGRAVKVKIEVHADDCIADLNDRKLNQTWGDFILDVAKLQFVRHRRTVSQETVDRRRRAADDGESGWYKKRYMGGRIGHVPPLAAADRTALGVYKWGMDSGRLINGMVSRTRRRSTGGTAAVFQVPANRLEPRSFGDMTEFRRFMRDLKDAMPILRGEVTGAEAAEYKRRSDQLMAGVISNNERRLNANQRRLRREQIKIAKQLLGFLT